MAFIAFPQPYVCRTYKFSSIIASTDSQTSIREDTGGRNWKSLNKLIHLSCKHLENQNVLSCKRKHLIFASFVQNSNKEQYLKHNCPSFLYYIGVVTCFYPCHTTYHKAMVRTYKCWVSHVSENWAWINSGQFFQTGHSGTCSSSLFLSMSYCCPPAALCCI